VVEDRGDAVLDAVQVDRAGREVVVLQGQLPVDPPPHPLQDVVEVLRAVAVDRQAPGKRAVDVVVRVDQARHDRAASGVQELRVGVFLPHGGGGADLLDEVPFDDDGSVVEEGSVVTGDEPAVANQ